jgi:transposase-like protein
MQNELPKTLQQAIIYFSDKDVCLEFMANLRWVDGEAVCPACGCYETSFLTTRRIWKCKGCKKQFSVKVGTIFEDSPIGLDKWLVSIWLIANAKNGISSWELHRALGFTQKTAWFVLHRIRTAMENGSFEKLSGTVEVDETYIGGNSKNMHKSRRAKVVRSTGMNHKVAVIGMLSRTDRKVKANVIAWTDTTTLQGEIHANVEVGSNVMTDGHGGYRNMSDEFVHEVIDHAETYVKGNVHTNGIENFWSLLKRSLKGTYVSVEPQHLQKYVVEQTFRYNEKDGNDQDRFLTAVSQISGKRLTYAELTGRQI